MRTTSVAMSDWVLGRPGRRAFEPSYFLATSVRYQRRMVSGVTSPATAASRRRHPDPSRHAEGVLGAYRPTRHARALVESTLATTVSDTIPSIGDPLALDHFDRWDLAQSIQTP